MASSATLGVEKVHRLLFNLGWPAALNFLVVTIYNITDVIFVGHWLGTVQIAAVVIVGTINYLFSSFGLATGIGGASIISRALGESDRKKAAAVVGNQLLLVVAVGVFCVMTGLIFEEAILRLFGANGDIFPPAKAYYRIMLFGSPLLSLGMMGNCVIQAEGKSKIAMINSLVPALANIALNPVFIKGFNMGIEGAAWATVISFVIGVLLCARFFVQRKGEIGFHFKHLKLNIRLMREIIGIGGSVIINIAAINLFVVLLNKVLFRYQQESGVVMYSIISRINMLFYVPILGIDGGIRPIIGYNFGSRQLQRIRETILTAAKFGLLICYSLLGLVLLYGNYLVRLFTNDEQVIPTTLFAMRIVLSFFPLFIVEIIAVAYFQAIGKPRIAFGLSLLRNVILLIPLLYSLSYYFGFNGVLYTFPVVDIVTTIIAFLLLKNELDHKLPERLGMKLI
jgi:putative MATE family efflux protein